MPRLLRRLLCLVGHHDMTIVRDGYQYRWHCPFCGASGDLTPR